VQPHPRLTDSDVRSIRYIRIQKPNDEIGFPNILSENGKKTERGKKMHGLKKMAGVIFALITGFMLFTPALAADDGDTSRFFISVGVEYRVVDIPGISFGHDDGTIIFPFDLEQLGTGDFNVKAPGYTGELGFLLGPGIDGLFPGNRWRLQAHGRYFEGDRSHRDTTDDWITLSSIDGNMVLTLVGPGSEFDLDLDTDHREYEIGI